MAPPRWALLERQLLADNVPASREFFEKYFDERGYLQAFVRWGANDGPDDAFENFNRWPELHALGGSGEILRMYSKAHEGLVKQYTEAKTTDVPISAPPLNGSTAGWTGCANGWMNGAARAVTDRALP